jgi:hypothetical protein
LFILFLLLLLFSFFFRTEKAVVLNSSADSRTIFVYVATRQVDVKTLRAKLPNSSHVILLNHELLERCYGPSIKGAYALIATNARALQAFEPEEVDEDEDEAGLMN